MLASQDRRKVRTLPLVHRQSLETADHDTELVKCRASFPYFVETYCQILSETGAEGQWIPFTLWEAQRPVADALVAHRLVVMLKARQLGATWLVLAFALWLMLFKPIATVLLFSKRDDEAIDLLKVRLRGMHARLPVWMQIASKRGRENDHIHEFVNGSTARAFPSTGGDSYCATLAVVDEADLCMRFSELMTSVKPTIDAGGRMIILSRPDKSKPESAFKKIYQAAKRGLTDWFPIFLAWNARPSRDQDWYEAQKRDIINRTGALDDLAEQYPATDVEALAPRTLDKRIAPAWLQLCWQELAPLDPVPTAVPAIPGLQVFRPAVKGRKYVLGVDPAEGNPTSDDSAIEVLDCANGEEVASLAGRFQPAMIGHYAIMLARYYNSAACMVERNNHGHAVLQWLAIQGTGLRRLMGQDDKEGWLSSALGKTLLYSACADQVRNSEVILHDLATYAQLGSIEGATLKAPEGEHDDRADAFALACVGRAKARGGDWGKPSKGTNALSQLPEGVLG
jgi:hypothetical protein